jgi:hypothetical protein
MKDVVLLFLLLIVITCLHVLKIKHTAPVYTAVKKNVQKDNLYNETNQVTMPLKYISSQKTKQNNFPND